MAKEYQIKYYTENVYDAQVTEALFAFIVSPCQDSTQTVRDLAFYNSLGEEVFFQTNPFSFEVANIRTSKPFSSFSFEMTAIVEKIPLDSLNVKQLSIDEEQAILSSPDFFVDQHLYLEFSRYTKIADTYKNQLLYRQNNQTVYNYLTQLNQYIYNMLEFDPEPTHVHTTVNEVIELRRGVCQDYTHLFLGAARLNHIPCRYVSGYLNQGDSLTGSAVMHAWVEAYVPGYGWRGFDPTNNLLVDDNHIKAAHGTDYNDCSPIKGILKTNGGHRTTYGVNVVSNLIAEAAQ